MKAVCFEGKHKVQVNNVPDPKILNDRDAILKITTTCICGSDVHLYDGVIPTMMKGDILGHEFMGEVVETGKGVTNLQKGDRVVVPFTIACGNCFFCSRDLWSLCDNSNPNAKIAEKLYGHSPSGLFGFSHMLGGYAGGQAEYVRVPFADVGPLKIPDELSDEQVVFLTDIFPTGYMAVENCNVQPGDTICIFGCGPVGQFAIRSAYMLGAERVIAIDNIPERLALAATSDPRTVTINFQDEDLYDRVLDATAGRGPDAVVDAVGLEAHGTSPGELVDWAKGALRLATDRVNVVRQAIQICRKGGTVSIPGAYGGLADHIPLGAAFGKGLTFKMGQTHVHRYLRPLMDRIVAGDIDPTFIITHRGTLEDAPKFYDTFKHHREGCIKCVLKPA